MNEVDTNIENIQGGKIVFAEDVVATIAFLAASEVEDMGFSRVVLARELTLEEIRKIRSETKAELEVFVHGALCMSVSGMCYYSAMMGERSGNRGLCAQPCRLNASCTAPAYRRAECP